MLMTRRFMDSALQPALKLYSIEWLSVIDVSSGNEVEQSLTEYHQRPKYSDTLQLVNSTLFLFIHSFHSVIGYAKAALKQYKIRLSFCLFWFVIPAKYVRDLGIYIDCDMSMKTHVSRTVSTVHLLCGSTSDTQYKTFRQPASYVVSRQFLGSVATGLRQHCSHWYLQAPHGPSTVSAE